MGALGALSYRDEGSLSVSLQSLVGFRAARELSVSVWKRQKDSPSTGCCGLSCLAAETGPHVCWEVPLTERGGHSLLVPETGTHAVLELAFLHECGWNCSRYKVGA